jgi:hypothetical protein
MSLHNWILTVVEASFWYAFLCYGLYSIKHEVNIFVSALLLLFFLYGAVIFSPFVRSTDAWHRMMQ